MLKIKDCYYENYLVQLLSGLKDAVLNKDTSAVGVIDGRSGMGKTTLANQIGHFFSDKYNVNCLYYEPDKFLEALARSKKGDVLVFDEAMLLSSRAAMSEINIMIVQAMSMIRSKQLFVIFCVNSIFDLDKNLALSRADFLLHVYGSNLVDRGHFTAFFKGAGGQDKLKQLYLLGKKFYDYSKPKSNFSGRFFKNFIVDPKIYEKRKQEGVNNFLRTLGGNKKHVRKQEEFLFHLIYHLNKKEDYSQEYIAKMANCAVQTIKAYMAKFRAMKMLK